MNRFPDRQDYVQRSHQLLKQLEEREAFTGLRPVFGQLKTVNTPQFQDMEPLPKKPYTVVQYQTQPAASNVPYYMRR